MDQGTLCRGEVVCEQEGVRSLTWPMTLRSFSATGPSSLASSSSGGSRSPMSSRQRWRFSTIAAAHQLGLSGGHTSNSGAAARPIVDPLQPRARGTTVVNAAICDAPYDAIRDPVVIDLD